MDKIDDLFVFRRNNEYAMDRTKPIAEDTILTLDKDTGAVIHAFGKDMFFLPHMLTVDAKNNIWVTDVALHQVKCPSTQNKNRHNTMVVRV